MLGCLTAMVDLLGALGTGSALWLYIIDARYRAGIHEQWLASGCLAAAVVPLQVCVAIILGLLLVPLALPLALVIKVRRADAGATAPTPDQSE